MRFLVLIFSVLVLTQCATNEDRRFRVGQSERAFIIIGVAEAAESREARYALLWRRIDGEGGFTALDDRTAFEARTNDGDALRLRGVPGEFTLLQVEPGVYALDSVFAVVRERRVDYVADGIIHGPERPAFEVGPGEAVYLGIWQAHIEDVRASARPWRLSEEDLRAVLHNSDEVSGPVRLRAIQTRSVPCTPRPMNARTRRQVC